MHTPRTGPWCLSRAEFLPWRVFQSLPIADRASLPPAAPRCPPVPTVQPSSLHEQGPEPGWDEGDPDPRDCCWCSGWAGQAGDISWGLGQGGCTGDERHGSPGALRGLESIRAGVLGQDRGVVRGISQGGGWGFSGGTPYPSSGSGTWAASTVTPGTEEWHFCMVSQVSRAGSLVPRGSHPCCSSAHGAG